MSNSARGAALAAARKAGDEERTARTKTAATLQQRVAAYEALQAVKLRQQQQLLRAAFYQRHPEMAS